MATTYKIGNPIGIPDGVQILTWDCHYPDPKTEELAVDAQGELKLRKGMTEDKHWFEGDEFIKPEGMAEKMVQKRIAQGFIIEVPDSDEPETTEVLGG